jgi:hypothetical protein
VDNEPGDEIAVALAGWFDDRSAQQRGTSAFCADCRTVLPTLTKAHDFALPQAGRRLRATIQICGTCHRLQFVTAVEVLDTAFGEIEERGLITQWGADLQPTIGAAFGGKNDDD